MSCFISNKTMHDSDVATVLLNVYVYIVFVGKDYTTLVLSHLPNLRRLDVVQRDVCDEYSEELVAALPELVVVHEYGDIVVAVKNRPTNSSNSKDADAESSDTD